MPGNGKVLPGLGSLEGNIHRLNLLTRGAHSGVAHRPAGNSARGAVSHGMMQRSDRLWYILSAACVRISG